MISLLYSKSGYGKSFHIHEYSVKNNLQLIEINSSNINDFVLEPHNQTLDGRKTLFLFEGIDNLSGYSSKIASFLIKASRQNVQVFLTANNLDKVPDSIIKNCQPKLFPPYPKEKIIEILKSKFESGEFEEVAEQCGGNLHQAFHLMNYDSDYESTEEYDNLEAVKIILYEKDRDKVYKVIQDHNIGGLYNWLYETAAVNHNMPLLKVCNEINKKLYKMNEDYIKGILAYGIEPQQKLMVKLPRSRKPSDIETTITDKIRRYYKCSRKESFMYLRLISLLLPDKNIFAKQFLLDENEQEFIGIKKEEVKEQIATNIMSF